MELLRIIGLGIFILAAGAFAAAALAPLFRNHEACQPAPGQAVSTGTACRAPTVAP